jgi:hypothetical protein
MWSPRKSGIVWALVAMGFLAMAVGPVAGVMGRPQAAVLVIGGGVLVGLLAAWRAAAHQQAGDAERRPTTPPRG